MPQPTAVAADVMGSEAFTVSTKAGEAPEKLRLVKVNPRQK
jgi:hypothetical protein